MILTCDSCGTKFRLDPSRLKKPSSKVRCSRCGYVFEVAQPEEEEFVHVDLSDDVLDEGKGLGDLSVRGPAGPGSAKRKSAGARRLVVVLFALLVLAGAVWGIQYSGFTFTWNTETPEKKPVRDKDALLVSILQSTQGYFSENNEVGQIFVVEGEVVNESKKGVSFVLIEGRLYTGKEVVAQSQRCYAGNMITRDDLKRLGMSEIQNRMMNREGKDFLNVNIPAGKRVPFMVVFQKLPELDSLQEYRVEVVSAKTD